MADQERNVLRAFAQGRDTQRENIQAIIKVGPEFPGGDHARQIAAGRRHYSHIDPHGLTAANAFEFLLLQHAQQLGLQLKGNVSDFVEKQRAAMGHLEASGPSATAPGERAAFMTEQFAFDQAGRNGGTVDFDKGTVVARTQIMDRSRNEFFSRSGFSQNERGGIGWSDNFDLFA